jgi:hypothetical protein
MNKEEENIDFDFLKRDKTNPFRVPEGYFDSLDDRIMQNLNKAPASKESKHRKVIHIFVPALAVAASIVIVFLLTNFPFQKSGKVNELLLSTIYAEKEDSSLTFSLIDDNTLVNAIYTDEKSNATDLNSDEVLAYLSTGLNEVQICSGLQ